MRPLVSVIEYSLRKKLQTPSTRIQRLQNYFLLDIIAAMYDKQARSWLSISKGALLKNLAKERFLS